MKDLTSLSDKYLKAEYERLSSLALEASHNAERILEEMGRRTYKREQYRAVEISDE